MEVAQSHPTDVVKIANTIVAVRDAPCPPVINSNDPAGQPTKEKLVDVLSSVIYDMLTTVLGASGRDTFAINPQNPLLTAAMISGACARCKLCNSAVQAGHVTCGLHFDDSDYKHYMKPAEYEVNALHACLQLLVGGSVGYTTGQMGYDREGVLPALKSIAKKNVIKSENGKNLLQVCRYRSFLTCLD